MKKRKKNCMVALTLCLLIPAGAMAVTEGVVENAPQVEMEQVTAPELSYLPDESYYAGYGDWVPAWEDAQEWVESEFDGECYHDVEQRPRMTAGEAARAEKLLADYNAGKIAYMGENILNKMENVIVGVYALDPASYAGEAAFVILPGPCMTDEQILAVIDAYDQLGLTFDPAKLSALNCARGGGIETNRFLSQEEGERYRLLARLIERGLLDVSGVDAAQALQPNLDARYFCGLPDFTIRPYRAATDEEFVAMLIDLGHHDMTGEIDFGGIEKESRMLLCSRLGAPLSMELSQIEPEGSYVPNLFDKNGRRGWNWNSPARKTYGASLTYHTPEGILVYANVAFDQETKQLVGASLMYHRDNNELYMTDTAPSQEIIDSEIAALEEKLGLSGLTWHVIFEDETWTNWGQCIPVRAQVAEGEWMTIYVAKENGMLCGLELCSGTLVEDLGSDEMPVNG